jgi:hypothetical protein
MNPRTDYVLEAWLYFAMDTIPSGLPMIRAGMSADAAWKIRQAAVRIYDGSFDAWLYLARFSH